MTWRRRLMRLAAAAAVREVSGRFTDTPEDARDRFVVDPDWRRVEDGYAARLDARTTIDVARPVGRWADVDPRLPQDAWRSWAKAAGLSVWAGAVGVGWWAGTRRSRGPLAVLHRDPSERRDDVWA